MPNPPQSDFPKLMEMARGFQVTKVFLVAVDLSLFDYLEQPATAPDLAPRLHVNPRALEILLNALCSLDLLLKEGASFKNSPTASRYLVSGREDYRGAIFRHIHHTWRGWSDLEETVVTGVPPERDPSHWVDAHPESRQEEMRDFIWGMHANAREVAPDVAALLDLTKARRLLDLGGGPGTYAISFVQANADLRATVFDLPGPLEITRENIARHNLSSRIDTKAGNFLKDAIGQGYDFIWISHILHSHDEDQCRLIIGKAVKALAPNGRLAIQDFYLNDDGTTPPGAALFSVHMLAVTPHGRAYKFQEVAAWMQAAGLREPTHRRVRPDVSFLLADKS